MFTSTIKGQCIVTPQLTNNLLSSIGISNNFLVLNNSINIDSVDNVHYMFIDLYSTGNNTIIGYVYDKLNDKPNNLIAQTEQISTCYDGLKYLSFPTPINLSNGEYYFGVKVTGSSMSYGLNNTSSNSFLMYYNPLNNLNNATNLGGYNYQLKIGLSCDTPSSFTINNCNTLSYNDFEQVKLEHPYPTQ